MGVVPRLALARLDDGVGTEPLRQRQSLLARQTARLLLPPGPWVFDTEASGRPRILSSEDRPCPDLSLSHSGPWVAAALAPWGRVGVDVEVPKQRRDVRALADAYLSAAESQAVTEEGEPALLAFWTMREAMAKLSHGGLAEVLALDGARFASSRDASCSGLQDGLPWVLAHSATARFHISIAWMAEHLPPRAAEMLEAALESNLP